MSIRTVARSFYFDHIKSDSNGPMQRSLDSVLKRIDRSSVTVKHALADKYPNIIKPEVSAINISLTSSCNLRCTRTRNHLSSRAKYKTINILITIRF